MSSRPASPRASSRCSCACGAGTPRFAAGGQGKSAPGGFGGAYVVLDAVGRVRKGAGTVRAGVIAAGLAARFLGRAERAVPRRCGTRADARKTARRASNWLCRTSSQAQSEKDRRSPLIWRPARWDLVTKSRGYAQLVRHAWYWSVGVSRPWRPKATCHGATLFRQSAAGTRGCSGRVPCDHRRSVCLPLLAPPHCTTMRLGPVRGCTASLRPPARRLLSALTCARVNGGLGERQAQLSDCRRRGS